MKDLNKRLTELEKRAMAVGSGVGAYISFADLKELNSVIKQAEALEEIKSVAAIKAGNKNWQAKAKLLEQKYPDRWGKKEMPKLIADIGQPAPAVKAYIGVSPDDWDKP